MTCIVGMKYKDGVILGADTRASDGCGGITEGVEKLIQFPYGYQGIACSGAMKAVNLVSTLDSLIDYRDILDDADIDIKYTIQVVAPVLEEIQKATQESGTSVFIFGTDKRLFTIYSDASVLEEPKPFVARGSTGDAAMAVLEANYRENLSFNEALDLLTLAIESAGANNVTSNFDVNYINITRGEIKC